MKRLLATPPNFLASAAASLALCLYSSISDAAVTPGGTLGDKAIITEIGGGETLEVAPAGGLGAVLVNDFDNPIVIDPSYELNPSGADATQIALSSGRHLVLYNTEIDDPGGANRAEFQANLTLAGSALVAGRSQGYLRRAGGADEAVLSGGAIITVAADDAILTLETRRSDNNADTTLPLRAPGLTAIQLLKLDNSWDYLSLERRADQTGVNSATFLPVAYDSDVSTDTHGSSFSVAGADITLSEAGLYLVFANTSIEKAASTNRTQYQQRLTLGGNPVDGSVTTTYVRGNEDTNEGMVAVGMVIRAAAGQVLNVEVNKEVGDNGVIQGGETAITMVKLPSTAEFISLIDITNQEVNDDPGPDPVTFATQVDASSTRFSHSGGGSAVTVNEDADYLFFGAVFTSSDATNDNHDRIMPLHGWQIDGGGMLVPGRGCQYNRDNGSRTSGSWGAAILSLAEAQTVEMVTQRLGNGDQGADSAVALQGLSIKSLLPSNDPTIVNNGQLSLLLNATGTIGADLLQTVDADDAADALTYTVTSAPALGALKRGVTSLGDGGTFTQEDIDSGAVTFTAGSVAGSGGFDFKVEDDSGSGNAATGSFLVAVGAATVLADDTGSTDEDTVLSSVIPGPGVLANDLGTGLTVIAFDAVSAQGALVSIDAAGTVSYDPTAAPALQALDDGDLLVDRFTYTVTDFSFATTAANVNISVSGANDAPVVIDDQATGTDRSISSINVLANDSDVDRGDRLVVVSVDGNPVGVSGLTLLSGEEGTITIGQDGSFSYDPSTSSDIGSLSNGASLVDVITYEVSDGTVTVPGTITITSVGTFGASNDLGLVSAGSTTNINILGNDDLLGPAGTPTAGAVADFNAADAGNTDANWINNGTAAAGLDITMEGAGTESVLNTSLSGAPVGVTAAYDLSGSGSGTVLLSTDDATNIYGSNISTSDLTLEMVFRPDDLVGPEPLWGSGGNGTGASLVLLDDQLIFTAGQGAVVVQAVGTLTSADYVQVVATLNLSTDTAELYINNSLVGSGTAIDITTGAPADITDWSGTDDEGLGRSAGTTGGDINVAPFLGAFGTVDIPDFNDTTDRFDGEIAVLRAYSGATLDAAARAANSAAVFGTLSTPGVGDIVELAGTTALTPGTTVVTLPSGATVKLEADGTLTYNPNGAFDHVAVGLEGIDSFEYRLGGSTAATATVVVRIFGTNSDPQVTIAADQADVTEGGIAGFTLMAAANVASTVTVNLSYSGTAADGSDFSGQASRTIAAGTASANLDLATIADSLFEGRAETIVVTIASVTGPATIGAAASAGTLLIDGDSPPVLTIAGGGSVTEGSMAGFTVTASVAASAPVSVDVGYTGTATAADFSLVSQLTIAAMQTTASFSVLAYDDGIADAGETVTVTLSNPSLGSIGSPASATTTIADGSGQAVFFADFEGVDPLATPGGTVLNSDAPAAANLGTAIGSWANVLTAAASGSAPGLVTESDDARGDGIDTMLRQDRPATSAAGELCAVFDGAIDISGGNTGTIAFDVGQLRTLTTNKNTHVIGLDAAGNKSFEFVLNADNANPSGKSLYHVDPGGVMTQLSGFNSLPNTQDISGSGGNAESAHANIRLGLSSSGYTIALDHPTIVGGVATPAFDGVPDFVTGELAYAGGATSISKLLFAMAGSTNADFSSGLLLDNVSAAGTRLTTQQAWRKVYYGSTANSGPAADAAMAANGLTNLQSFALGLDPTQPGGVLDVDASTGTILSVGPPTIWVDPADSRIYLRHSRRADLGVVGLTITDEFSRNPGLPFEASALPPTVIAAGLNGGAAIEVVQTEFPFALPISGGEGRYGRVDVAP